MCFRSSLQSDWLLRKSALCCYLSTLQFRPEILPCRVVNRQWHVLISCCLLGDWRCCMLNSSFTFCSWWLLLLLLLPSCLFTRAAQPTLLFTHVSHNLLGCFHLYFRFVRCCSLSLFDTVMYKIAFSCCSKSSRYFFPRCHFWSWRLSQLWISHFPASTFVYASVCRTTNIGSQKLPAGAKQRSMDIQGSHMHEPRQNNKIL